jgi:molybdopterin molybdotransferase
MISVKEAKELLNGLKFRLSTEKVAISAANGRVLAKDIRAKLDMPPFDQSAVDGYVFMKIPPAETEIKVIGEIRAGDLPLGKVDDQSVFRIYTGSPVPNKAFTVLMQEKVISGKNHIIVPSEAIAPALNIRRRGNQYVKGDVLLCRGKVLNPPSIGLIASQGIPFVDVIKKPSIGLLTTGSELIPPGTSLKAGQLFESNSFTLTAALSEAGYEPKQIVHVKDDKRRTAQAIARLLKNTDLLIITGGISVGKYDLVRESLINLGVKELFYKVKQKPGKPLFVGVKGKKIVFGLPGNPAAVLACFHHYVLPVVLKRSGVNPPKESIYKPLVTDFSLKDDRDLFLRAKIVDGKVQLLAGQDSDNLLSFVNAEALVYLPSSKSQYASGDLVEVFRLNMRNL